MKILYSLKRDSLKNRLRNQKKGGKNHKICTQIMSDVCCYEKFPQNCLGEMLSHEKR